MALIRFKRGTRAQLDAAAAASQLNAAEPYYLTDEEAYAIGTSATTYITWGEGGGGGVEYTVVTTPVTLEANQGIVANTTTGPFTVTLPAIPAAGTKIFIADGGDWSVNNLTVARNGSTIEDTAEDLVLDVGGVQVGFIYDGSTWQVYPQAGVAGANTLQVVTPTDLTATNAPVDGQVPTYDSVTGNFTWDAGGSPQRGVFVKSDTDTVAWTKTGNGTATTGQALFVEVGGEVLEIANGTSITMPTLSAGTDYAIWANPDGTLQASAGFNTPPVVGGRRVGGFHYAPGGNASAQAGGDSTPQINEYSFWDLKFRPSCEDPRGMTLVAGGFWADIYLLNNNPDANGTSAFGVTIADGSAAPIIPAAFGGNGATTYGVFKWYHCQEVLAAYGKKAPTYAEFMALAYGVTEETARGTDPGTTQLDAARTSKWGVIQATGNLWVWGRDVTTDGTGTGAWRDITEGRGEIFTFNADLRAGFFGAHWADGALVGSRCASWVLSIAFSNPTISGRGVCSHLILA